MYKRQPYILHLLAGLPRRNEWVFASNTSATGCLTEPNNPHTRACKAAGLAGLTLQLAPPARLWPVPLWMLQAAGHLTRRSEVVQRLCSNLQVDISKAQKVLGWTPAISLSEGLHRPLPQAALEAFARRS